FVINRTVRNPPVRASILSSEGCIIMWMCESGSKIMQEQLILTDENLDSVLKTDKPVTVLVSGDGIRGDITTAFTKAPGECSKYIFAQLDPKANPHAAERFGVSGKPLLIGWYCGDTVARRSRPWGSDMALALEQM